MPMESFRFLLSISLTRLFSAIICAMSRLLQLSRFILNLITSIGRASLCGNNFFQNTCTGVFVFNIAGVCHSLLSLYRYRDFNDCSLSAYWSQNSLTLIALLAIAGLKQMWEKVLKRKFICVNTGLWSILSSFLNRSRLPAFGQHVRGFHPQ